jgi:hypothetical protein
MERLLQRLLALCAAGSGLAMWGGPHAHAYTIGPPSPALICLVATHANLVALEQSLRPVGGSTVPANSPVTFSGFSSSPLSFAVASSPAQLANPDLDSGPGTAQAGESYTFTSTKATAKAGTVYWTASFSTSGVRECAGQAPQTETTRVQTLTVTPLTAAPAPAPAPQETSADMSMPSPVSVRINTPSRFRLAHPTVVYRIQCTASCSGETSYRVVFRRHGHLVPVARLNLASSPFSIGTSGGEWQFSHRYSGQALRLLRRLVHDRHAVILEISVSVTDPAGNASHAEGTVRLGA